MEKFYIFILGFFNSLLYTPIVLSFVFIVLSGSVLLAGNDASSVLRLIPNGSYNSDDIMRYYGVVSLIASVLISIIEIISRKKFVISIKNKAIVLIVLLTVGYAAIYYLFITKTEISSGTTGVIIVLMYIFAVVAVVANALLTKLIRWVDKTFSGKNI